MKNRKQKSTSAECKVTINSGINKILGGIKSYLRKKCKELQVIPNEILQEKEGFVIHASTKGGSVKCPCCGTSSQSLHSYRPRKLQCLEFMGCHSTLILKTRHMKCRNPECPQKIFAEPLKIAGSYARMTNDVLERVSHESLNQASRPAVETLSMQKISVSQSTCQRIVRRIGASNPDVHTSGSVGIDDFAKCKGRKYMCMVVDHYTGDTLAVFDSRYGTEIQEWFAAHPKIRFVTRDGCQTYASIIDAALPDATQVSDRFHLVKNLREIVVEQVRKLIKGPKAAVGYPIPSEEEARRMIFDEMCSMGEKRHRLQVQRYYKIRELQQKGMTTAQIGKEMSLKTNIIYKAMKTDISKVLGQDQKSIVRNMHEMARIISTGVITPETVLKRMSTKMEPRLVYRCMKSITAKYKELRKLVRQCNSKEKAKKVTTVSAKSIWKYVITGDTQSKKLATIMNAHTQIASLINICREFYRMIHDEENALDVDEWIEKAIACKCRALTSFAKYIRQDKEAVSMACMTRFSNALLEGNVNRAKAIKRAGYNRASPQALRAKLIYQGRKLALEYHLN